MHFVFGFREFLIEDAHGLVQGVIIRKGIVEEILFLLVRMLAERQIALFPVLQVSQFFHVFLTLRTQVDLEFGITGIGHKFVDRGEHIVVDPDILFNVKEALEFHVAEALVQYGGILFDVELVSVLQKLVNVGKFLAQAFRGMFGFIQLDGFLSVDLVGLGFNSGSRRLRRVFLGQPLQVERRDITVKLQLIFQIIQLTDFGSEDAVHFGRVEIE